MTKTAVPNSKAILMSPPYIHPLADVKTKMIGVNTNILQFCVVLEGATIGESCSISPLVYIDNDVVIGNNVEIRSGAKILGTVLVEDNVYIGDSVTFSDAPCSQSMGCPDGLKTKVKAGAVIGANVTVVAGVQVSENAEIKPGTVVTRSVPSNAIVAGNPGRIVGYANTKIEGGVKKQMLVLDPKPPFEVSTAVRGVTVHRFPIVPDLRGSLTVGEFEKQIPFAPRRYFMVFDVPSKETRGEHAHRECHQFLICLRGSCSVLADDGVNRTEVLLDSLDKGVYLPPMVWGVQYKYSQDAILLVFASHHYDASDYIREYSEFIGLVSQK